jgi:hypothetical protein
MVCCVYHIRRTVRRLLLRRQMIALGIRFMRTCTRGAADRDSPELYDCGLSASLRRFRGPAPAQARYAGMVPTVTVEFDKTHALHSRARGTHAILPMADIVRVMLESGVKPSEIRRCLGMQSEEVQRLANRAGMPEIITSDQTEFGHSWVPTAERNGQEAKRRPSPKKGT